jgi:hypothetical protein
VIFFGRPLIKGLPKKITFCVPIIDYEKMARGMDDRQLPVDSSQVFELDVI